MIIKDSFNNQQGNNNVIQGNNNATKITTKANKGFLKFLINLIKRIFEL